MNAKSKFFYGAWRVLFALVFSLSVAGLSVQNAQATGYVVTNLNNSGAGSLRQAIINANANAGADTITFTVSGTITLAANLPAISDNLTIDGRGQNVTVSGNNLYRILSVNSGKTVTLDTLVITKGYGGAVGGGGILNNGGTLTVRNSAFTANKADVYGGAIDNDTGTVTIVNSSFTSNNAEYGGAINSATGTLVVTNSTFSTNSATNGGAIWSDTSATVRNSTFKGNSAQNGGAIDNYGGTLTVINSTFSANSASLFGGGIGNFNAGDITVLNSTFSANSATDTGGGIYVWTDSSLTLKNTILANSTSGGDCANLGTLVDDVNNLIVSNSGCGTPVSSADPMLAPLNNNGGLTQTFALFASSPAIGEGDDATCAAAPVNNLDQRGLTRPYDTHCDIGSVEVRNESATMTFRSVATYDGWVLESGENTNVGGSRNTTATTFNVGDGAGDKQYRAILSFNTAAMPDNAVITNVTLKIRKQAPVGTDPFTILGGLKVDMRKPYFGTSIALVVGDFQATAGRVGAATFNPLPVNSWYSAVLNSAYRNYVNLKGSTQFRLYFTLDDNNDNAADYMKFFSGNYGTVSARPTLLVEYYLP
ncbi:MAG: choice-of-anchor Q domain-containing protein [Chloroflexota bacterium]